MKPVVMIPARMGSSRFPGKPLADDTGTAMVVHVCQRAAMAEDVDRVVVATDSAEIVQVVLDAGFEAVMTSDEHPNGTSRLAQAAEILGFDDDQVLINVQGDEPEIEPGVIEAAYLAQQVGGVRDQIGTVVVPIVDNRVFEDPNIVKAVMSGRFDGARGVSIGRALYFSRSAVPYRRVETGTPAYRHVGIYAYTVGAIRAYLSWEPSAIEVSESLEQLRWYEHGYGIMGAYCASGCGGIDTPEQYRAFVERFARGVGR
ncbi:MAG: 3-deoxy-manno-octulosonate cytidylyltransferase [Phycisphaerales bacterium]